MKANFVKAKGIGMYIHIPFCASKCAYCDFLSFEGAGEGLQKQYVRALIEEMKDFRNTPIDTVYIGGATPTALPSPLLCEILQEVHSFNLAKDAEITVEMNPCTGSYSLLKEIKSYGVNRLSIGLQAWQDELLAKINRTHTANDFTRTIQAANAAGISNINVDLMFALPSQTLDHWRESIAQVIACSPQHISTYSLTPAENTPLWSALEAGKLHLPDEATDRAMYHEAISLLSAAGYDHYEISNFAKPGYESRHNIDCWRRKPYIGSGLGAHSFDGITRWSNTSDMTQYLEYWNAFIGVSERASVGAASSRPLTHYEEISPQDAMAEAMFLGLRMTKGVNPKDFHAQFGRTLQECYGPTIESLISKGLLAYKGENIALTPLGLDLANQVFEAFL